VHRDLKLENLLLASPDEITKVRWHSKMYSCRRPQTDTASTVRALCRTPAALCWAGPQRPLLHAQCTEAKDTARLA
jgi:hypothetical protein